MTTVRKIDEPCAKCKKKGYDKVVDIPVPLATTPIEIVERELNQIKHMQDRFDMHQAADDITTDQMSRLKMNTAISMEKSIKAWNDLQKGAQMAAAQLSREQMPEYFLRWFQSLPTGEQTKIMQSMSEYWDSKLKAV